MLQQIILITTGEPAGIGPDICLDLVDNEYNFTAKLILIGDINVLKERSLMLGKNISFNLITKDDLLDKDFLSKITPHNSLNILNVSCYEKVIAGTLSINNACYVMDILNCAITLTRNKITNKIVTAPVHKGVINKYGINFTGHTEYLAKAFNVDKVVMMLANDKMRVALLTTHIPLSQVPSYITLENLNKTLKIIFTSLAKLGIENPKIAVCGLNPHAGEDGEIGKEEVDIINPVIQSWQQQNYKIYGCYSADTLFLQAQNYDLILAMYHDQGLPVLKYANFNVGVNVTLGLPIIRTSVDHGTALSIAGTGKANSNSLIYAIQVIQNSNV